MSEPIRTYKSRVRGLWSPAHLITDEEQNPLGTLTVNRNWRGMVVSGDYRPEKGEVLHIRRDPGLLRAQFSIWTEDREWLGASLRPNPFRRSIEVWTGNKPYRVVPTVEVGRGWRIVATKTGDVAEIRLGAFSRTSELALFRKLDFELLLFAYFLGHLSANEFFWPTSLETLSRTAGQAKPSRA